METTNYSQYGDYSCMMQETITVFVLGANSRGNVMESIRGKIYLPAVKAKQGELKAISGLSQDKLNMVLPLIIPIDDLAHTGGQLQSYLTTDCSIHLLIDVSGRSKQEVLGAFQGIFRDSGTRSFGICVNDDISVRDLTSLLQGTATHFSAIRFDATSAENLDSRIQHVDNLREAAQDQGIDLSLILDFHAIESEGNLIDFESVGTLILKKLEQAAITWNRIFILSGGFPRQISFVPDTVSRQNERGRKVSRPRRDLQLWMRLRRSSSSEGRFGWDSLLFGDYSVFYAGQVRAGNQQHPSATNIRYAQENEWVLLRGKVNQNSGFYELCAQLKGLCLVDAPTFSEGDYVFNDRVSNHNNPGGGSQWLQWSSSHHLAYTIRQLSNSGAL